VGVNDNLVDIVWGKDKPARPREPIKVLDVQFAGKKFQEKLEDLRKEIEKKKGVALIICKSNDSMRSHQTVDVSFQATLDDIAWLFNLRGSELVTPS